MLLPFHSTTIRIKPTKLINAASKLHSLSIPHKNPIFTSNIHALIPISARKDCNFTHYNAPKVISQNFKAQKSLSFALSSNEIHEDCNFVENNGMQANTDNSKEQKSFWGAVNLIIGTAVGPGMLGLPAFTIKSGPLPSSIAIFFSWVYVISSIILVAELSFAAMEEDGVEEVSFTGLATKAFGDKFGAFVAVVYASLSFSLLLACVSGIGAIVSQWFPWMNPVLAAALFPSFVGTVIGFFPFMAIDSVNRMMCLVMFVSITALVGIGMSVARTNVVSSFLHASWSVSSILPAIPVTVLTLGFHVITPFICRLAGNTVNEARKAVLIGGAIPLVMVLSWNLIVLGLSGTSAAVYPREPISLLLSVNPSALPAVQGFAFSALATSLIGYAVSFPKQLVDTVNLIFQNGKLKSNGNGVGKVGLIVYPGRHFFGKAGRVSFSGDGYFSVSKDNVKMSVAYTDSAKAYVMPGILGVTVLLASFFCSTFSTALDFAGVYANCFLFGILPPLMMYIHQSRKKLRSTIVPGGDFVLLLLFGIAFSLGIWH